MEQLLVHWLPWVFVFVHFSAFVCPLLNFGLPPHCPQVVWCHWGEIEPFSSTLAQGGLAECDQPGKNPLKYSAVAGNRTRAMGRTDSELSHWAIMTWVKASINLLTWVCIIDTSSLWYVPDAGSDKNFLPLPVKSCHKSCWINLVFTLFAQGSAVIMDRFENRTRLNRATYIKYNKLNLSKQKWARIHREILERLTLKKRTFNVTQYNTNFIVLMLCNRVSIRKRKSFSQLDVLNIKATVSFRERSYLIDTRFFNELRSIQRQEPVGGYNIDSICSRLSQHFSYWYERLHLIDHVILRQRAMRITIRACKE